MRSSSALKAEIAASVGKLKDTIIFNPPLQDLIKSEQLSLALISSRFLVRHLFARFPGALTAHVPRYMWSSYEPG